MKKHLFVLTIIIIIAGCAQKELTPVSAEFYSDFASENNRIAGQLSRKVFKRNLETLTYDYYYQYLKENIAPSAEGVVEIINNADQYIFKSNKHAFLIALYFKDSQIIICDISNTGFADWVFSGNGSQPMPTLKEFVEQKEF